MDWHGLAWTGMDWHGLAWTGLGGRSRVVDPEGPDVEMGRKSGHGAESVRHAEMRLAGNWEIDRGFCRAAEFGLVPGSCGETMAVSFFIIIRMAWPLRRAAWAANNNRRWAT